MDEKDIEFIRQRERLARWWNPVGYVMLAVFIGMVIWLFISTPNFINPLHVIEQLKAGTLQQGTLVVMAGMLPIMVLGLFLVCCTVIGFVFVAFANERRYLRIIAKLQESEFRSQPDTGYTIHDACSKTIIHRRRGEEVKENKFFLD